MRSCQSLTADPQCCCRRDALTCPLQFQAVSVTPVGIRVSTDLCDARRKHSVSYGHSDPPGFAVYCLQHEYGRENSLTELSKMEEDHRHVALNMSRCKMCIGLL